MELLKIAFVSVSNYTSARSYRSLLRIFMGLMYSTGDPCLNFLILNLFSSSRSLDGILCALIHGSCMSVHSAISIV